MTGVVIDLRLVAYSFSFDLTIKRSSTRFGLGPRDMTILKYDYPRTIFQAVDIYLQDTLMMKKIMIGLGGVGEERHSGAVLTGVSVRAFFFLRPILS